MNTERQPVPTLDHRVDADEIAPEVPRGLQRTSPIDDADTQDVSSHPGLLALARVLRRHAARADLRRIRRGTVPVMAVADGLLTTVALIVGALIWSIMAVLR